MTINIINQDGSSMFNLNIDSIEEMDSIRKNLFIEQSIKCTQFEKKPLNFEHISRIFWEHRTADSITFDLQSKKVTIIMGRDRIIAPLSSDMRHHILALRYLNRNDISHFICPIMTLVNQYAIPQIYQRISALPIEQCTSLEKYKIALQKQMQILSSALKQETILQEQLQAETEILEELTHTTKPSSMSNPFAHSKAKGALLIQIQNIRMKLKELEKAKLVKNQLDTHMMAVDQSIVKTKLQLINEIEDLLKNINALKQDMDKSSNYLKFFHLDWDIDPDFHILRMTTTERDRWFENATSQQLKKAIHRLQKISQELGDIAFQQGYKET